MSEDKALAYKLHDYEGLHSVSLERLKTLHHDMGLSINEVAQKLNSDPHKVSGRLAKAGISRICAACGNTMNGVREDINYCSKECEQLDGGETLTCPLCGEEIKSIGRWVSHRNQLEDVEILHTPEGYDPNTFGSWYIQRKAAMRRANESCEICDSTESLEVHHVVKRRFFDCEERSHALSNLVVLCLDHHTKYEGETPRDLYTAVKGGNNE